MKHPGRLATPLAYGRRPGRPGLPDQVILQVDQVLFEIAGEAHHLKAIPLSVASLLEGLVQIVEVNQLGP